VTSAADEQRHPPGPHRLWEESWYFDFVSPDGSLGGYVRLGVVPRDGVTWFWAALVGRGRPLVTLRDHDVEPPRGRALEARASGLWVDLVCETPLEHWSVGLEAFAVAMDDPAEACRGERGDPTALGLDLEWEGSGPPAAQGEGGYGQACTVHGDVLVGRERIAFEGTGWRTHLWGPRDWWGGPWSWAAGTFDDGTAFSGAPGNVMVGGDGLPVSATLAGDMAVSALAHAPLLVPAPGGGPPSRLARALCRYDAPGLRGPNAEAGYGWAEWLQPGGPARDLPPSRG